MSIHALSWVLRHSEEKLGRRLVLIVLADHAKDDGSFAWPSVETIGLQARLSRRAVQDALRQLETAGSIRKRGTSSAGTSIYDVVMGGAESAPRAESGVGGAQNATAGGAKSAPEPSVVQPSKSNRKNVLSPDQEPVGFGTWLAQHVEECGRYGIERSVPKAGTSYRSDLARTVAGLLGEGYSLEDLRLASVGVLADEFMREGGHTKPENVLRKTKIGGRVDEGRAELARREDDPYSAFDKGDPRGR